MKRCNLSIKALFLVPVIFGYISQAYAEDNNITQTMKILWQREVTADANLDCSLGPVALDKTNKKLLITGTSFRPKVYSEGKFWLMELDTNNGDITRKTIIKEANESNATLMLASSLLKSLMVSENNDISLSGKFDGSAHSIMKINRSGNTNKFIEFAGKNNDANKNREDFSKVHSEVNLSNGNILLMGGGSDGGIAIKVDSEGTQLWKRNYKIGQKQVDLFNDGLSVENKKEFVIVGCSVDAKGKFPDVTGDDFVVRCNAQGDIIAKDIFTGNPWPGEQPRICRTSSGNFIVVYGKGMQFKRSEINIRAYSPDLKLLWEKQVVKSEKNKPSSFKITATPQNGFIVAANVDFGNLRVYEYDNKGDQVATFSIDKAIKLVNIGLACTDNEALVVFQNRQKIDQNEEISRIKIIALELK
ncbi:MAG: hypothetical protein PHP01_08805 [Phycisphaerae bacterium]|nr:hypothetical protein [Phycisphaerae bacterium]